MSGQPIYPTIQAEPVLVLRKKRKKKLETETATDPAMYLLSAANQTFKNQHKKQEKL